MPLCESKHNTLRSVYSQITPRPVAVTTTSSEPIALDFLYFNMTLLQSTEGGCGVEMAQRIRMNDDAAAEDEGLERSIYWKADFRAGVEVGKNFRHELGNHGYAAVIHGSYWY
jgi:hypothetical protein